MDKKLDWKNVVIEKWRNLKEKLISTLEKQDCISEINIIHLYKIKEKLVEEWLKKLKQIKLTLMFQILDKK